MVEERFLTVNETSDFLKISISTLNRLVRQDKIPSPSHKVRGRRLFDKDELIEWVGSHKGDGHKQVVPL